MKKSLFVALLVSFVFSGNLFAAQLPGATGQDVVSYLNEVNYQSWQLWPGKTELYKGRHPHGALLTTYVSKGAYQAIEGKAGNIPSGICSVRYILRESTFHGYLPVHFAASSLSGSGFAFSGPVPH